MLFYSPSLMEFRWSSLHQKLYSSNWFLLFCVLLLFSYASFLLCTHMTCHMPTEVSDFRYFDNYFIVLAKFLSLYILKLAYCFNCLRSEILRTLVLDVLTLSSVWISTKIVPYLLSHSQLVISWNWALSVGKGAAHELKPSPLCSISTCLRPQLDSVGTSNLFHKVSLCEVLGCLTHFTFASRQAIWEFHQAPRNPESWQQWSIIVDNCQKSAGNYLDFRNLIIAQLSTIVANYCQLSMCVFPDGGTIKWRGTPRTDAFRVHPCKRKKSWLDGRFNSFLN
jgi:hypothetical protein